MAKERRKIDLDTFKEMIDGKEVDISYHLCIYHGSIEVEVEDDTFINEKFFRLFKKSLEVKTVRVYSFSILFPFENLEIYIVEDDGFNIDFKITSKSKHSEKIYECSVSVWKL